MSLPRPRHFALLLLACLSIAGAALSGCGTARDVAAAADPVEEAIAATAKAEGARFEMRMGFSGQAVPGAPAITARGVADLRGNEAQLTIDLGPLAALAGGGEQAPDPADLAMELRVVDGTIFLRGGLLSGGLPAGKSWIGIEIDEVGRQLGIDPAQLTQLSDPTEILEQLKDAGDVTEAGRATIRGVETTRYRARIDFDRALSAFGSDGAAGANEAREALAAILPKDGLPAEVWIGDDGLLRRMEMSFTAGAGTSQITGAGFGMSVRLDLFDYGTKVSVKAPPASEVADGSQLLGAGIAP